MTIPSANTATTSTTRNAILSGPGDERRQCPDGRELYFRDKLQRALSGTPPDYCAWQPGGGWWHRWIHGGKARRLHCLFTQPDPDPFNWLSDALAWTYNSLRPWPESRVSDYWQTPTETLSLLSGDCEDGAILLASIAYSGPHSSVLFPLQFAVGSVGDLSSHAFLTWDLYAFDWITSPDPIHVSNVPWSADIVIPLPLR